jgi:hypothetical protein
MAFDCIVADFWNETIKHDNQKRHREHAEDQARGIVRQIPGQYSCVQKPNLQSYSANIREVDQGGRALAIAIVLPSLFIVTVLVGGAIYFSKKGPVREPQRLFLLHYLLPELKQLNQFCIRQRSHKTFLYLSPL